MGMFDYVRYSAPCFKCGEVLTEWQSKDGDCALDTIEPPIGGRFYADCPKCRTWNEYKVIPPRASEIVPADKRPQPWEGA
jgi:hypothetical protein